MNIQILQHRRIILGVSASVSIYKSLEILQLFKKLGASVRVVMSEEAKKFISPLLFESLCEKVLHKETESWLEGGCNHISLARWGEVMLIAPATANTINKLAAGIADNLLLSTFLAFEGQKIIAPAANSHMYMAAPTQESLKTLSKRQCELILPISKELACGVTGMGALEEVEEIVLKTTRCLLAQPFWLDREVLVSGGGSIERIDRVRYISNFSSGKMAQNLCMALYLMGANVKLLIAQFIPYFLLCGKLSLSKDVPILNAQSANEYHEKIKEWIATMKPHTQSKTPFLFMAAAISDYSPKQAQQGKLKKEQLGTQFNLELAQNVDILASLSNEPIYRIGFKLEEQAHAFENAKKALIHKNLHAICLNTLESHPLGTNESELFFITKHDMKSLPKNKKLIQSFHILEQAALLGENL